jgi:hypothetical protein
LQGSRSNGNQEPENQELPDQEKEIKKQTASATSHRPHQYGSALLNQAADFLDWETFSAKLTELGTAETWVCACTHDNLERDRS